MSNPLVKFGAGLAAAVAMISAVSAAPVVAGEGDVAPFDFASCVRANGGGTVMLLIDESGSVFDSDTKGFRIAGAKALLAKIDEVVDRYAGTEVSVMVAGIGDNFVDYSGGWVTLEGSDALSKTQLVAAVQGLATPTANKSETDMYSSLAGAQKQFDVARQENPSGASCSLLAMFKDGDDWQYFNPAGRTVVDNAEINDLLLEKKYDAATSAASSEICRAQGIADGFRSQNIYVLSVALGSGDFSKLTNFSTGANTGCGSLPGYGMVVPVPDPLELPGRLANVLDPTHLLREEVGSFPIHLTNALRSISIQSTSESEFSQYTVTAPATCRDGERIQEFSPNSREGVIAFGQGVQANVEWYSDNVLRVVIEHTNTADESCWTGDWLIEPGDAEARSVIEFDADLQAVAKFEDTDFYVSPGDAPRSFAVQIERISDQDGQPVDIGLLDDSLTFTVTGYVADMQGNKIATLFPGVEGLTRATVAEPHELQLDADVTTGKHKLVLELNAVVEGLGVGLRSVRTEIPFDVRGKDALPTIESQVTFADVNGQTPATGTITVKGSPDKDFTLDFASASIALSQAPADVLYDIVLSNGQTEVVVAQGQTVTFDVELSPQGDEPVYRQGRVAGDVIVNAIPARSESQGGNLAIPFTAEQKPDANSAIQWWLVVLFMALGAALTFLALRTAGYLIAKFPPAQEVYNNEVKAIAIDGTLSAAGFVPYSGSIHSAIRGTWSDVDVDASRKSAQIAGHLFVAHSPGWRLSSAGFGRPSDSSLKGASSLNIDSRRNDLIPRIGLELQRSWAVWLNGGVSSGGRESEVTVPATALLIIADPENFTLGTPPLEADQLADELGYFTPSEDLLADAAASPSHESEAGFVDTFGEPKAKRLSFGRASKKSKEPLDEYPPSASSADYDPFS